MQATGVVINPKIVADEPRGTSPEGLSYLIGKGRDWEDHLRMNRNLWVDDVLCTAVRYWVNHVELVPASMLQHIGSYDEVAARLGVQPTDDVTVVEYKPMEPKA